MAQMFATMRAFFDLCLESKKLFILTLFSLMVTAFVTLAIPFMFRYMIDTQLGSALEFNIIIIFFLLICCLAIGTALRYYSISMVAERVYNRLRSKIFAHIIHFSHYEFQKIYVSDLVSRLSSDAEIIREFIISSFSIAARNILLFTGGLVMMLHTGFFMTLILMLIIPVIMLPIIIIGRKLKQLALEAQEKLAASNSILTETLNALPMVQNYNAQNHQLGQFDVIANAAYQATSIRIYRRSLMTFWIIILLFSSIFMVLFYGSYAVNQNLMTAGQFTQFILYSVFTAGAASSLSEVWGSFYKVQAAYQRLNELLEIKPYLLRQNGTQKAKNFHKIEVKSLSLTYDNRQYAALSDVNLSIAAGEKIAFVGESGSGKTSLLKILLRDLNPSSGIILWNNQSIDMYDHASLKQFIAYVSQEVILFSGTIEDNIKYGNLNANPNQIIQAAIQAEIHEDIMRLPDGYKTDVGERGFQLSGGQRQRIAIARCLLKDSPIWLLDEPTSALDGEIEHKIFQTLLKLTQNKTLIISTHRLSILSLLDKVYRLEKGKLKEEMKK